MATVVGALAAAAKAAEALEAEARAGTYSNTLPAAAGGAPAPALLATMRSLPAISSQMYEGLTFKYDTTGVR